MSGYMQTAKTVEWATPQDLFDELDREFHFTLDPCCTHENAKCKKHYTIENDGLMQNWGGGKLCSAILPMEGHWQTGWRNAIWRVSRRTPS